MIKRQLFSLYILAFLSHLSYAESGTTLSPEQQIAQNTLYLLGYDIPVNDMQAVVQADIDYLKTHPIRDLTEGEKRDFPSERLPKIADMRKNSESLYCHLRNEQDCLQKVKANQEAITARIKELNSLWVQIDRLIAQAQSANAYTKPAFHTPLPRALIYADTPIPDYFSLLLPLSTRHALIFLDEPQLGMQKTCEAVALGKALMGSDETIIQALIGVAMVEQNLTLLNEMLMHSDKPLPASCRAVLKPLPKDRESLCHLKGELHFMQNTIAAIPNQPILAQRQTGKELLTQQFERYCAETRQASIAQDNPSHPLEKIKFSPQDCVNHVTFCRELSPLIENNNFAKYQPRLQDANAYLRLWQQTIESKDCQLDTTQWHADGS